MPTRVRHIYGLRGARPHECGRCEDAEKALDLGYYEIHTDRRTSGLHVFGSHALTLGAFGFGTAGSEEAHLAPDVTAQIWVDALGHAQLHLLLTSDGDVGQVADHLRRWCDLRRDMRIEGEDLPRWVAGRLASAGIEWDQDVLQVVSLPDELATELSDAMASGDCTDVTRLVYRRSGSRYRQGERRVRTPPELNHEVGEVAAHGRGVVVLGGHSPDRVATLSLIGAQQLFALARVRGIRVDIEEELRHRQDAGAAAGHWRRIDRITQLSETVRQVRIRLVVDVQAFADGIYMPEIVLDDFRRSFAGALHLPAVVDSTAAMLDSLAAVAEAYRDEAELTFADERQATQQRWQYLATVASAVAIPLSLVFTYFGISSTVDVPSDRSVFDLAVYWPVWLLAVFSVCGILLVSWWAGRRGRPAADPASRGTGDR